MLDKGDLDGQQVWKAIVREATMELGQALAETNADALLREPGFRPSVSLRATG